MSSSKALSLARRQAALRPARARPARVSARPPTRRRGHQEHLIRFIENHDEPPAAATFGVAQLRAAAVVTSTLQGARLYHDGQLEGRHTRVLVQLARGPTSRLTAICAPSTSVCCARLPTRSCEAATGACANAGARPTAPRRSTTISSLAPGQSDARHLVAVNLSPARAEGRVRLPWGDLAGRSWSLADKLSHHRFERSGDDLASQGFDIAL